MPYGIVATNHMTPMSTPISQSCAACGPKFLRQVPLLICKPPNQSRSETVAPQNTGIQLASVEKTGLTPSFCASSPTLLAKVKPRLAQELNTPEARQTSKAPPNPRRFPFVPSWRSRRKPALPQTTTPATHPAIPISITLPAGVRRSAGDLTRNGRSDPTAVLIPMMVAKPNDIPASVTP